MPTTHEPNTVVVNVFQEALPPPRQVFGVPLFLITETGNTLTGFETSVGSNVAIFSSAREVAQALAASVITAQAAGQITRGFQQSPVVPRIIVATAALNAYEVAYANARTIDDSFYGVAMDTAVAADVLEVSAAVETDNVKFFAGVTGDTDWLTAGIPAAYTAATGRERTGFVFHDSATEAAGLAWLAARLGVADPDNRSAPWTGQLREVPAYTTQITAAQRDAAIGNNANIILPFPPAPSYIKNGENIAGRPVYQILSGDWYAARVREDLAALKLGADSRGEKIIIGQVGDTASSGQTQVRAILEGRAAQGIAAGHFNEVRVTMNAITADDITNQRIRADVEAQIAQDAIFFSINVFQTTQALQEA